MPGRCSTAGACRRPPPQDVRFEEEEPLRNHLSSEACLRLPEEQGSCRCRCHPSQIAGINDTSTATIRSQGFLLFVIAVVVGLSLTAALIEVSYRYLNSSDNLESIPNGTIDMYARNKINPPPWQIVMAASKEPAVTPGGDGRNSSIFPTSHLPGNLQHSAGHGGACGDVWYTYCARPRRLSFYYKRSDGLCTAATDDSAHVCSKGPNRFTSLGACRRTCLGGDSVPWRCRRKTRFGTCGRSDMKRPLWFFNGSHCFEWAYPLGQCPAPHPAAFRSLRECRRHCGLRRRAGGRMHRPSRCRHPEPTEHCSVRLLRFPVFAVPLDNSPKLTCVRAGPSTLLPYRCLRGTNRFRSAKECELRCL